MNEYDIRSMTLEELQAVMEKIGRSPLKQSRSISGFMRSARLIMRR